MMRSATLLAVFLHVWAAFWIQCAWTASGKGVTVSDEAGFLDALQAGAEVIVVTNHLDLMCFKNSKGDKIPSGVCKRDKKDEIVSLSILKSTRAIVVRSHGVELLYSLDRSKVSRNVKQQNALNCYLLSHTTGCTHEFVAENFLVSFCTRACSAGTFVIMNATISQQLSQYFSGT
jgi:hypothetical protein